MGCYMLGVNEGRFTIGKEVYYPFAVEMHYFRVNKRYWSVCFERIKKAGFRLLSTGVPWNLHQGPNKDIDFTGYNDSRKDLIVFLELAREFGFKVILRPGPWISGQWPQGGLPKFLFRDIKVFARDCKGQEISMPDDHGVEGGYLPSYLNPTFQHSLKNYFKTLVETTKNYIHPRGPVFMVELDFETSFGRNLHPGSADYNPEVIQRYYPSFLQSRYGDIARLNKEYHSKDTSFEAVEPPRKFDEIDFKDLPIVFDWFRFRELTLKAYLTTLEEIFKSYTVEPLFFRSLYFKSGDLLPAFALVTGEEIPMLGTNIFPHGTYFDLAQKGRYLAGQYDFAWAASFTSGAPATEKELNAGFADYPDGLRRFYLTAGLASGFKGLNHYMFVSRDHWRGAPLASDGTITSGYDVVRNFNAAVLESKLHSLERLVKVCVVGNRSYQWYTQLENPKQFAYIKKLVQSSSAGLCRDLLKLKIDYDIRETIDPARMKKYDLVYIASAEFMGEEMQEGIIELLKQGTNVMLCGLMPKFDGNFKECQTLSRQTRIKTSLGCNIDRVKGKAGEFTAYVYGHVVSTDSKIKKLLTSNRKTVGVASSRFKGTLFLFTFDIASDTDHNKLVFLESIFNELKIQPFVYCSDPSVDIVLNRSDKKVIMYIVAPPSGELTALSNASTRELVISADLRKAGLASAKLKVKDLLAPEETPPLKISADNLRRGIAMNVSYPDGQILMFEKG